MHWLQVIKTMFVGSFVFFFNTYILSFLFLCLPNVNIFLFSLLLRYLIFHYSPLHLFSQKQAVSASSVCKIWHHRFQTQIHIAKSNLQCQLYNMKMYYPRRCHRTPTIMALLGDSVWCLAIILFESQTEFGMTQSTNT